MPTPSLDDPLLALTPMPFRGIFYPLGFAVELQTNSEEILHAAAENWCEPAPLSSTPAFTIRLGQTSSHTTACPPPTNIRAFGHLLSILADADNFASCDLRAGFAFGWVTEAAVQHRRYLRYHFLEAIVMCMLSASRATPIHGACVSHAGRGLLLCGDSGAGKSTLTYACARAGWTLTSDDASYLLWHDGPPRVRGNPHLLRFRPSCRELFPELQDRALTPRVAGKPSIEIPTVELPHIATTTETQVHAVIRLARHTTSDVSFITLQPSDLEPYFAAPLFPLEGIRELQAAALEPLLRLPLHEIRYRDLPDAIACLEALTATL